MLQFIYLFCCLQQRIGNGTGTLNITCNITNITFRNYAYGLYVKGNLTVEGGTIIAETNSAGTGLVYGVHADGGDITVNSGSLSGYATSDDNLAFGVRSVGGGITAKGGTINAIAKAGEGFAYGARLDGDLLIDGGTLNCSASSDAYCCGLHVDGNESKYTSGKLTAEALKAGEATAYYGPMIVDADSNSVITDMEYDDYSEMYYINEVPVRKITLGSDAADGGGSAPVGEEEEKEPPIMSDTTPPIVPVIYDITKTGDTFSFKVIIANGRGNMAGAAAEVKLNEKYTTSVTIGEDGIGYGTIEAPGFTGGVANFRARVFGKGAGNNVTTPMIVYSDGRVARK